MWTQQDKQRLEAAEEQRQETLEAAFSPGCRLDTLGLQQRLLVEEADANERDPRTAHVKEEQKEIWIGVEGGQLGCKEETDTIRCPKTVHMKEELWHVPEGGQLDVKEEADDANRFPVTVVLVKSGDVEEKPPISQLHQRGDRDILSGSSACQVKAETDGEESGGAKPSRTDLDAYRGVSNSSAMENSKDNDVDHPDVELETDDSDDDWVESRTPESAGNSIRVSLAHSGCPSTTGALDKDKKNLDTPKEAQKGLKCDECAKSFDRKSHLNKHMRVHTGEKPFMCDLCGQSFSMKSTLNSHMRIHTGEKPFGCDVCGHRFSIRSSLNKHLRIHTGEKPFTCGVCGNRFSAKSSLDNHTKTHTGEKPFDCNVCGHRFSRKSTLNMHALNHSGQKRFVCDVCGKGFNDNWTLKKHNRIHTGEKPFDCEICGKSFNDKSTLKKHTKIHIGCKVCGKRFNQEASLNIHMRIHTEEKHMVMILLP